MVHLRWLNEQKVSIGPVDDPEFEAAVQAALQDAGAVPAKPTLLGLLGRNQSFSIGGKRLTLGQEPRLGRTAAAEPEVLNVFMEKLRARWRRPAPGEGIVHASKLTGRITVILGDEYDQGLHATLGEVLADMGAHVKGFRDFLAGSQDVRMVTVRLPQGIVKVASETYVGLTLTGAPHLVLEVKRRVQERARTPGSIRD